MENVNHTKIVLSEIKNGMVTIPFTISNEHAPLDNQSVWEQEVPNKIEEIFTVDNPIIDFEKSKFLATGVSGVKVYFANKISGNYSYPVTPTYLTTTTAFEGADLTGTTFAPGFEESYFKFDFYNSPEPTNKLLFTVAVPVTGTIKMGTLIPTPFINYGTTVKPETMYLYWLRKQQQIPNNPLELHFSGTVTTLYCRVSFHNQKTGQVTSLKGDNVIAASSLFYRQRVHEKVFYLRYHFNYANLRYTVDRFNLFATSAAAQWTPVTGYLNLYEAV